MLNLTKTFVYIFLRDTYHIDAFGSCEDSHWGVDVLFLLFVNVNNYPIFSKFFDINKTLTIVDTTIISFCGEIVYTHLVLR